ncbi:MAG: PIN domain-containing protein [Cyanobacteria bacterium J06639_14]
MTDFVKALFNKYRQKGILIDTNILLLYFVGTVNQDRISRFKRTASFVPEDYNLLCDILAYFSNRVTTPNILTEVNSLANQLGEPERSQCFAVYARDLSLFDEKYIQSNVISKNDGFTEFGLTDCGILELAMDRYLVLTDDLKLATYLQRRNVDTVNFNNLRVYGWN